MDAGSLVSSFSQVSGYDGTSATYTVTTGGESIVSGTSYRFKTVATNDIGDSEFSSETRYAAASLPA